MTHYTEVTRDHMLDAFSLLYGHVPGIMAVVAYVLQHCAATMSWRKSDADETGPCITAAYLGCDLYVYVDDPIAKEDAFFLVASGANPLRVVADIAQAWATNQVDR